MAEKHWFFTFIETVFTKKTLRVISIIALGLFIIALSFAILAMRYVYSEGQNGREIEININGIRLGADPYISANVNATCNALMPTATINYPINTATDVPKNNITLVPNAEIILQKDCVPTGWFTSEINGKSAENDGKCLKLTNWNISGLDKGISITAPTVETTNAEWIYIPIKKQDDPITFFITISDLYMPDNDSPSPYFFFGNLSTDTTVKEKSDFIIYYIYFTKDSYSSVSVARFNSLNTPFSASDNIVPPAIFNSTYKTTPIPVSIIFYPNYYEIQIGKDGENPKTMSNLGYQGDYINLVFGYRAVKGGRTDITISGLDLSGIKQ